MPNTELLFSTDEADIVLATQKAVGQLDVLLKVPVPFNRKVSHGLGMAISLGRPKWKALPTSIREDAQALGFKPCCIIRWGYWPLPTTVTPVWVGPDGFTSLEINRTMDFFLSTLFTDGTALVTTNATLSSGSKLTENQVTSGDFRQGYADHLQRVRQRLDTSDVQQIYTTTPALIRKRFKVFYRLRISDEKISAELMHNFFMVFGTILILWILSW